MPITVGDEEGYWYALKEEVDGSCLYEFYLLGDMLKEGTAKSMQAALEEFETWRKGQLN